MAKFYITSAIPYVNAKPHIGHALEFIQTNAIVRYHQLIGDDVTSLSGGDENALKNVQAAEKANAEIQEFVDQNNQLFEQLTTKLNAKYNIWQKGSDTTHHFPSSQKLWQLCQKNGDIYKKSYQGLYCVGCETFYSPDELNEKGECSEHPGKQLEEVKEENYFFKLSTYQDQLEKIIRSDVYQVVPQKRKNEVLSFINSGLQDISISRSNERAKNWGVPVPGDDSQRIYVWFDALNIYQSGVGFGWDESKYQKLWPADVHVVGKGITRFHAVYWPAFLLSAGLKLPKKLLVHEYFTVNGQKMSKTIGNVYDPVPLVNKIGADPLRYYCLAKISPFADGDFSEQKVKNAYNTDLANGLGNLVQRVATLAAKNNIPIEENDQTFTDVAEATFRQTIEAYRFNRALTQIWSRIRDLDKYINDHKLWAQKGKSLESSITPAVSQLRIIGLLLQPFLPDTSQKILEIFKGPSVKIPQPLFPRLPTPQDT